MEPNAQPVPGKKSQRVMLLANRWSRVAFAVAVVAVALSSFRAGLQVRPSVFDFASTLGCSVGLSLQCYLDARARLRPMPLSTLWLFAAFSFVAVPAYWIYHRGWRGVMLVFGAAIGLTCLSIACIVLGWYLRTALLP